MMLRRSFDAAGGKSAIHMVSAWATANRISLGQVTFDRKSNEITAIPRLLEMLDLAGALVTIDAMGCQVGIAERIVDAGAGYCLAVKANQPTLHRGIIDIFAAQLEDDRARASARHHETNKHGHGRDECRFYAICPVPEGLPDGSRWAGLKANGMTITDAMRDGRNCCEARYYILSQDMSVSRFTEAVRGHWGIESMHWQLDVTFGEDQSRTRVGHAGANFSVLRRAALGLLKNEKSSKVGIKNRRLRAGWDERYLQKVLCPQ